MDPTSLRLMQGAGAAAKPISFIGSAQAATNSLTLTIDKPTGTTTGDLLIAIVGSRLTRTWTGDTGWTEVLDQGQSPSLRVAYIVAGSSEPASYTFTANVSTDIGGVIATFRGAAYDVVGAISTDTTVNDMTAPAITLSTASSAILAVFMNSQSGRTWSNATAGLVATASQSTNPPSWALYREENLAAGSTGTRSATSSMSLASPACVLVGIKPA